MSSLNQQQVPNVREQLASLARIQDRLASTSNEDLSSVLCTLLPQIIPLSNTDELRGALLNIFQSCLKRIKPLKSILPIDELLLLVRKDMLPYACNFAVAFIDASIAFYPKECFGNSLVNVLGSICDFPSFSAQSNALCYYSLHFIHEFAVFSTGISLPTLMRDQALLTLADFYLDMALISG